MPPDTRRRPGALYVRCSSPRGVRKGLPGCSGAAHGLLTAGCIDTGLPAGRRNFGQSVKTLIETANVHHARWVMFTETSCEEVLRFVLSTGFVLHGLSIDNTTMSRTKEKDEAQEKRKKDKLKSIISISR